MLAIVPVLMFAFAALGMTIEVLRPDLAQTLTDAIAGAIQTTSTSGGIAETLVGTLKSWRTVGIVALLSAGYAGTGWVGNIRQAIHAMSASDGIEPYARSGVKGFLAELGRNLLLLLGLLILGAITVGVSISATAAKSLILGWLGLSGSSTASVLTSVAAIAVSLLSGWLLFIYLYSAFPKERQPIRAIARGALFGSIGLAALQYFAGFLNGIFLQNKAAAVFGPIIILMLSLNIFATLVMMGAAWTATAGVVEKDLATESLETEAAMQPLSENEYVPEKALVSQKVAKRGVAVGIASGYAFGGAAGIGLGAVLGRIAGAHASRRRRKAA